MEYRQLGSSGLLVSVLALGTWGFGGTGRAAAVGQIDVDGACRQLSVARDHGINLVDTANSYSGGLAEEILGEALERESARDDFIVASKVRMPTGAGPNDAGLSRFHIIRSVEASLRRLRTDHIDLYQVHEWDGLTPIEETLEALDTLVGSGKVRYLGASNLAAWQMMKYLGIAAARGMQRFVSHQIYYSLLAREAEYELIPLGIDQGVGTLVWSPLAGGLLTGKYRRDNQEIAGSRRQNGWTEPPMSDTERTWSIIESLVHVAQSRQQPAGLVTLAYLLGRPGITSLVLGARNEAQLVENLSAVDLQLTRDEQSQLDEISSPPLQYPYWHQARHAVDRVR